MREDERLVSFCRARAHGRLGLVGAGLVGSIPSLSRQTYNIRRYHEYGDF